MRGRRDAGHRLSTTVCTRRKPKTKSDPRARVTPGPARPWVLAIRPIDRKGLVAGLGKKSAAAGLKGYVDFMKHRLKADGLRALEVVIIDGSP